MQQTNNSEHGRGEAVPDRVVKDQKDGLIIVDKPAGITSHDVVSRLRRICGTRRVGHAGTLDPMATGVLVLGVNRGTRLLHYLVGADKAYSATIRLGVTTSTEDAEGEVLGVTSTSTTDLRPEVIDSAVARLTGAILQVPSAVSAIKVAGRRAYERVRAGEEVVLPPRPVTIKSFTWSDAREVVLETGEVVTDIDAHIECSSGTYIRALARDLGNILETGGHLTALRRTRVGAYEVSAAATLDELNRTGPELLSLGRAAAPLFPSRELTADEVLNLGFGKWIEKRGHDPHASKEEPVAAVDLEGNLIALLAAVDSKYRPVVVFAPASQ